jgi:hypothetical protein
MDSRGPTILNDLNSPNPQSENPLKTDSTEASHAADLKPVDLKSADLKPADLKPADLKSVDLTSVDLTSMDLKPADMKPADMKPADLKPADMKPADLKPADHLTVLFENYYLPQSDESEVDKPSTEVKNDLDNPARKSPLDMRDDLNGADKKPAPAEVIISINNTDQDQAPKEDTSSLNNTRPASLSPDVGAEVQKKPPLEVKTGLAIGKTTTPTRTPRVRISADTPGIEEEDDNQNQASLREEETVNLGIENINARMKEEPLSPIAGSRRNAMTGDEVLGDIQPPPGADAQDQKYVPSILCRGFFVGTLVSGAQIGAGYLIDLIPDAADFFNRYSLVFDSLGTSSASLFARLSGQMWDYESNHMGKKCMLHIAVASVCAVGWDAAVTYLGSHPDDQEMIAPKIAMQAMVAPIVETAVEKGIVKGCLALQGLFRRVTQTCPARVEEDEDLLPSPSYRSLPGS